MRTGSSRPILPPWRSTQIEKQALTPNSKSDSEEPSERNQLYIPQTTSPGRDLGWARALRMPLDRRREPLPRPDLYLPALDGLRLLAFLLVLVHHAGPIPGTAPILQTVSEKGWIGVELFFVISSFLFFHLFTAEADRSGRISIGLFFVRRLLRLYPLMVAYPALMLLVFGASSAGVLRLGGLGLFADNIISWFMGYNVSTPLSAHLWTLSFEFQVYLVIPFAFIALQQGGKRDFLIGSAVIFAFCFTLRLLFTALGAQHPIVWVTPFLHPDSILFGVLLAIGIFARVQPWLAGIVMIGAGALFWVAPQPWINLQGAATTYSLAALACGALVALSVQWAPLGRILSWKPIAFLGSISFGLYVFHLLGLRLTEFAFADLRWNVNPASSFPEWALFTTTGFTITTLLSVVSYYMFERPFLRLKDRFTVVRGR
jgi:peptidoglycan/LPS O-acetylase OafA/YrhL